MWWTPDGERILQGAEARLFKEALGMIVDMVREDTGGKRPAKFAGAVFRLLHRFLVHGHCQFLRRNSPSLLAVQVVERNLQGLRYVDLRQIHHGAMFKGSKGFLIADFDSRLLLPFGDNADLTYYRPRTQGSVLPPLGHFQKQWVNACKNSGKTACDFEYSGNMIEQLLLGLVAYRVGKKIHYDGADGRVMDCAEANELLRRNYRKGWTLDG